MADEGPNKNLLIILGVLVLITVLLYIFVF